MDEDGKAGSGLIINGNRVSRLVVEDFVEIWALGVRKWMYYVHREEGGDLSKSSHGE